MLLVGDEQLLPRLQMGINAPLLARLSFCLRLQPWTGQELNGYVQARLQEVGIHANPFDAPALQLLTLADLLQVVRYLQKEIRNARRNVGALKLSNLLQLDRFEEDLNISHIRLTAQPPLPKSPSLLAPTCSEDQQQRGRQKALEQLSTLKGKLQQALL